MNISSLIASFGGPLFICAAIVSIFVSFGVYRDAQRLKQNNPVSVKILSPGIWALVCLFGSIPALALYWAAHHSSWSK
ncbi:hypothetical protein IMCC26134_04800 [Verrucomicrobia bacterium IMCC26134]|nr:hypothetical protein IMCC26134_04800 [Verrucomicrobia bacterium IMCC26134]